MFALEINFKDGVSQPEMLLVRRPLALIGSTDEASVVIEDMSALNYQIEIARDAGRRFRCRPLAMGGHGAIPSVLQGVYEGTTALDIGSVLFNITSLDVDLALRETEPPDRAGVRVLRQACATLSPSFPALVMPGDRPLVISFVPDQPVFVGRSKECALRIDSNEVSGKHARIGYESGEFWVEDLGSTNGTFVNGQQIAGRVGIAPGVPIFLGRSMTVVGVTSESEIQSVLRSGGDRPVAVAPERRYPILLSVSEVARPARLMIPIGTTVTIGRDPKSDMWLGAPHISRSHCMMSLSKTGVLTVHDQSTNGTAYDGGILRRGDVLETSSTPRVLDFGGGVTVAVCFSEEHERRFSSSHGALRAFLDAEHAASKTESRDPARVPSVLVKSGRQRTGRGRPSLPALDIQRLTAIYRDLSPAQKLLCVLWCTASVVVLLIVMSLIAGLFS